eukprot:5836045-Pyramimonas_sp.AAC.1
MVSRYPSPGVDGRKSLRHRSNSPQSLTVDMLSTVDIIKPFSVHYFKYSPEYSALITFVKNLYAYNKSIHPLKHVYYVSFLSRHNTILRESYGPTAPRRVNLIATLLACPQRAGVFKSIPGVGSHVGYILSPLLRLVLTPGDLHGRGGHGGTRGVHGSAAQSAPRGVAAGDRLLPPLPVVARRAQGAHE